MDPIVTPAWLLTRLDDPAVRVVDCRYDLRRPGAGRAQYRTSHITGAAFLDLETDLSDPPGDGSRGRHPLPSLNRFQSAARRAGVDDDATVVAYDDAMTGGGARLWWLLRHFGHEAVAVLDGGFAAWDGPTSSGDEPVRRGNFAVREVRDDTVDRRDVAARLRRPDRVLLDARAPERFRGEVEPVDGVAGRIPGARNAPYGDPVPDDLRGAPELVAYCGSGVTATVLLLRLAAAGRPDAKLYPGSYSEWVHHAGPVETGPAGEGG